MDEPMLEFDDEPEDEFDTYLREVFQETFRDVDLYPDADPTPMPYSPTWAKKEEALLKKVYGDDFDYQAWLKRNREEGQG